MEAMKLIAPLMGSKIQLEEYYDIITYPWRVEV